jgi:hypothetical protein
MRNDERPNMTNTDGHPSRWQLALSHGYIVASWRHSASALLALPGPLCNALSPLL